MTETAQNNRMNDLIKNCRIEGEVLIEELLVQLKRD